MNLVRSYQKIHREQKAKWGVQWGVKRTPVPLCVSLGTDQKAESRDGAPQRKQR